MSKKCPSTHFDLNWNVRKFLGINGALGGIRTPNLLIRSQKLYPVELRVLVGGETITSCSNTQLPSFAGGEFTETLK